jgi:hypothetical protein
VNWYGASHKTYEKTHCLRWQKKGVDSYTLSSVDFQISSQALGQIQFDNIKNNVRLYKIFLVSSFSLGQK